MSDEPRGVKRQPVIMQDGHRLRRRRFMAKLTQEKAADAAGITITWLSLLENGHKSAGVETLAKLAELYSCDVADLMPLERPKPAARPKMRDAA